MELFLRGRKPEPLDDLSDLEAYLNKTLTPVSPDESFVRELQGRLFSETFSYQGVSTSSLIQFLFMSAGIMMGVSFIIITGIRILISLFGLIGLIQSARVKLTQSSS
jgi:hypothetical protein